MRRLYFLMWMLMISVVASAQYRLDSTFYRLTSERTGSERAVSEKYHYKSDDRYSIERREYSQGELGRIYREEYKDGLLELFSSLSVDSSYYKLMFVYDELGRQIREFSESSSSQGAVRLTSYLKNTDKITHEYYYRDEGQEAIISRIRVYRYDSLLRWTREESLDFDTNGDTVSQRSVDHSYQGDTVRWSHSTYWNIYGPDSTVRSGEELKRTIYGDTISLGDTLMYETKYEYFEPDSTIESTTTDITYEWGRDDIGRFNNAGTLAYRDSILTGSYSEFERAGDIVYQEIYTTEQNFTPLDPKEYQAHLRNVLKPSSEWEFYLGIDDRIEKQTGFYHDSGRGRKEAYKLYFYEEATSVEDQTPKKDKLTVIRHLDPDKVYIDHSGRSLMHEPAGPVHLIEIGDDKAVRRVFYYP